MERQIYTAMKAVTDCNATKDYYFCSALWDSPLSNKFTQCIYSVIDYYKFDLSESFCENIESRIKL